MIKLAFTVSTINPYTGKRLREWQAEGINGFISECYTPKEAKSNRFLADHCIVGCKDCHKQHSLFGFGKTPMEAFIDCKKQLNDFQCGVEDTRTADILL